MRRYNIKMNQPAYPKKEEDLDPRLVAYRARRDKVDEIDIRHIFEALDGEPNQDGDHSKWKVDGYNIIHRGQGWKNVSTDIHKGHGGVSLVQHIKQFERQKQAVEWIENIFGASLESGELKADPNAVEQRTQSDFEPPDRLDTELHAVEGYLINERGLPASLVKQEVARGTIYGSRRWDERRNQYMGAPRCVFLGPASAEIRELGEGGFKGCCRGSQTDVSGFRVPFAKSVSEKILALQEAAVDSLSYRTLFPGRYVFSTNGVGRFNLQYKLALQAIDSDIGLRLALDADYAGDMASQRIFNALFLRHRLSKHLGVEPEQIDAWMMSEAVVLQEDSAGDAEEELVSSRSALATLPGNSPHELFFNTGWQERLPERAAEMAIGPEGKPKRVWKETGNMLPPSIRLMVTRDVHPRMPRGEHWLRVSHADFVAVTEGVNVKRDRTPWGKDWNDALLKLGSSYVLAYEKAAKIDFKDGLPQLPYELERLRTPGLEPPSANNIGNSSGVSQGVARRRPTSFGSRS